MRTRNIGKKASGEGTSFVPVTVTTAIHQDEPTTPPEEAPAQNDAPEPPSLALPFPEEHGQPPTVPPLLPEPTANLRHLAAVTDEALVQLAMLGEAARVEGYPEYRDLEATLRVLQQGIGWEVASREVPMPRRDPVSSRADSGCGNETAQVGRLGLKGRRYTGRPTR